MLASGRGLPPGRCPDCGGPIGPEALLVDSPAEGRELVRWPSIAAAVLGLGVGLALVVPIVAFALFTRATIESDILARWQVDRELTARLAAAIVQRRLQSDVVSLGLFAGRPDVLEAIRGRDGRALDGLLAGFTSPNDFKLVGVVDPHGAALAHEPEGLVDPSFAADVAANAASVSQSQQGWTFMLPDGRAPTGAFGTVAVIVVPVDVGAERWAMYGLLDFNNFTSVFDPVPFQSYRSIVVLDEKGRLVVAYGTGLAITAN